MMKMITMIFALLAGAWVSMFAGNPLDMTLAPRRERRRRGWDLLIEAHERWGVPLPSLAGGSSQALVYPLVGKNPIMTELPLSPLLRDNVTANGTTTDMRGVDHICYVLLIGATDIVVDLKAQQGDQSDGSDAADFSPAVAVTQITATDDNKIVVLEIPRDLITKRFVRPVLTVGDGTAGADTAVLALPNQQHGELPLADGADLLEHVVK